MQPTTNRQGLSQNIFRTIPFSSKDSHGITLYGNAHFDQTTQHTHQHTKLKARLTMKQTEKSSVLSFTT